MGCRDNQNVRNLGQLFRTRQSSLELPEVTVVVHTRSYGCSLERSSVVIRLSETTEQVLRRFVALRVRVGASNVGERLQHWCVVTIFVTVHVLVSQDHQTTGRFSGLQFVQSNVELRPQGLGVQGLEYTLTSVSK